MLVQDGTNHTQGQSLNSTLGWFRLPFQLSKKRSRSHYYNSQPLGCINFLKAKWCVGLLDYGSCPGVQSLPIVIAYNMARVSQATNWTLWNVLKETPLTLSLWVFRLATMRSFKVVWFEILGRVHVMTRISGKSWHVGVFFVWYN